MSGPAAGPDSEGNCKFDVCASDVGGPFLRNLLRFGTAPAFSAAAPSNGGSSKHSASTSGGVLRLLGPVPRSMETVGLGIVIPASPSSTPVCVSPPNRLLDQNAMQVLFLCDGSPNPLDCTGKCLFCLGLARTARWHQTPAGQRCAVHARGVAKSLSLASPKL